MRDRDRLALNHFHKTFFSLSKSRGLQGSLVQYPPPANRQALMETSMLKWRLTVRSNQSERQIWGLGAELDVMV